MDRRSISRAFFFFPGTSKMEMLEKRDRTPSAMAVELLVRGPGRGYSSSLALIDVSTSLTLSRLADGGESFAYGQLAARAGRRDGTQGARASP
jgi:hypothetical protein